jgi:hypothetical protein
VELVDWHEKEKAAHEMSAAEKVYSPLRLPSWSRAVAQRFR